jgi:hypothetical protein
MFTFRYAALIHSYCLEIKFSVKVNKFLQAHESLPQEFQYKRCFDFCQRLGMTYNFLLCSSETH